MRAASEAFPRLPLMSGARQSIVIAAKRKRNSQKSNILRHNFKSETQKLDVKTAHQVEAPVSPPVPRSSVGVEFLILVVVCSLKRNATVYRFVTPVWSLDNSGR